MEKKVYPTLNIYDKSLTIMSLILETYLLVYDSLELWSLDWLLWRKVLMYSDCLVIKGWILVKVFVILTMEPDISALFSKDSLAETKCCISVLS